MPLAFRVAGVSASTGGADRQQHHSQDGGRATQHHESAERHGHGAHAHGDSAHTLVNLQHVLDNLLKGQARIEHAVCEVRTALCRKSGASFGGGGDGGVALGSLEPASAFATPSGSGPAPRLSFFEEEERGEKAQRSDPPALPCDEDVGLLSVEEKPSRASLMAGGVLKKHSGDSCESYGSAAAMPKSLRTFSKMSSWSQLEPRNFSVGDLLQLEEMDDSMQSVQMKTISAIFGGSTSQLLERRSSKRRSRFLPLHPDSTVRMVMDTCGMALLVYDSIMVPYMVAYEKGLEGYFLTSAWLTMLFWTIDLLANFATSYIEDDVLVTDWAKIAWQYVRTWLLLDFIVVGIDWASISLHYAYQGDVNSGGAQNLKVVRLLKASRLVRVLAVLRSGRFAQVQDTIMRRAQVLGINLHCQFFMGISKLVFIIMWLNHIGSCLWWVFVTSQWTDTGSSWHDTLVSEVGVSLSDGKGLDAYWYLSGMYWSVTAMFSGASFRPPSNSAEAAFSLAFVVFGMLFGSTLISSVAAMLVDFQMVQRSQNEKLRTLRKFLQQHHVKPMLAISIQDQVLDRMSAGKRLACQDVLPVLNLLSTRLRSMLWCDIYTPTLLSQPFLGMCDLVDDALMEDICVSAVSTQTMSPGEEVFEPMTPMSRAYVLIGGSMQYTPMVGASGSEVHTKTWLCELALWTHWTTRGLAESVSSGELLLLSADGLLEVLAEHLVVASLMKDYASAICKLVLQEQLTLSDLRSEIQLDEDHVIGALPQESRLQMSLPALHALQSAAGNKSKQLKGLEELENEVREGRCYLCSHAGCVLRVVQVVALRLRRDDGMLCVKVGEWSGGESDSEVVPSKAKIPGTKMRAGELPRQTVERLLAEEFGDCQLEIHGHSVEVDTASSDSYGVPTKYVRTVFFASLCPEEEIPTFTRAELVENEKSEVDSEYDYVEYWALDMRKGGDPQAPIYAWIAERDYTELANLDILGKDLSLAIGSGSFSFPSGSDEDTSLTADGETVTLAQTAGKDLAFAAADGESISSPEVAGDVDTRVPFKLSL